MRRFKASALPLLIVCLIVPTDSQSAEVYGETLVRDGVTHIVNPGRSMEGVSTVEPAELWRLGGESEAEAELFGRVEDVLLDEDGEVYFLDKQLNEIRVFSASGDYLRSIGREGEGPGEFRNATDMFFLPDGRLAVVQTMPTRIAVLGRNGDGFADLGVPLKEEGTSAMIQAVESRGERIVMSFLHPRFSEGGLKIERALIAVDGSGERTTTYKTESKENPPGEPVRVVPKESEENFYMNWVLGADGRVYVAPRHDAYAIHALGDDGKTAIIERDYESVKREASEIEAIHAQQRELEERYGIEGMQTPISPFERDIQRLVARDDGELWVLSSHGRKDCPEGALGVFDVFDARGRYVRELILRVDYQPRYDDFRIVGDRLFVLKEANAIGDQVTTGAGGRSTMIRRGGIAKEDDREPEPFEIVCYQLPPEM